MHLHTIYMCRSYTDVIIYRSSLNNNILWALTHTYDVRLFRILDHTSSHLAAISNRPNQYRRKRIFIGAWNMTAATVGEPHCNRMQSPVSRRHYKFHCSSWSECDFYYTQSGFTFRVLIANLCSSLLWLLQCTRFMPSQILQTYWDVHPYHISTSN